MAISICALLEIGKIISLISILSAKFNVRKFTFIDSCPKNELIRFQKLASENGLFFDFQRDGRSGNESRRGFLVLFSDTVLLREVLDVGPSLVIAVSAEPSSFDVVSSLVVPWKTVLAWIQLGSDGGGNGFYVYRPVVDMKSKIFWKLVLHHGEWIQRDGNSIWDAFAMSSLHDLREVKLKVGVWFEVELYPNKTSAFFWDSLIERHKFIMILIKQKEPIQKWLNPGILKHIDALCDLPIITSERSEIMDFVLLGNDLKYHLMIRQPEYTHSWRSVLKPFKSEVWICVAISVIIASFILYTVLLYEGNVGYSSCFIMTLGLLCYQASPTIPRNASGRIVCLVTLILSYTIYQFYTSNFYSLLSTREVNIPFSSLEEFVYKRDYSLLIQTDTSLYVALKQAKSGLLKEINDRFILNDPRHKLTSQNLLTELERVCLEKTAILGLPVQFRGFSSKYCTLLVTSRGYFPTSAVLSVRKNFPFVPQFKYTLMRLLEGGTNRRFMKGQVGLRKVGIKSLQTEPLSIEQVLLLFFFWGVSILLSFVILLCEFIYKRIPVRSFVKTNFMRWKIGHKHRGQYLDTKLGRV